MSGENRKIIVTDRANRQKDDFYQTPEWVTRVLLGFHKFDGEIWEPAAGRGDMAEVLKYGQKKGIDLGGVVFGGKVQKKEENSTGQNDNGTDGGSEEKTPVEGGTGAEAGKK